MLFDLDSLVESEKERNLYYKFFAGYFFNELIPGYEQRFNRFLDIISNSAVYPEEPRLNDIPLPSFNQTHVTFDMHGYLFYDKKDAEAKK